MSDVEAALADLREARDIHRAWIGELDDPAVAQATVRRVEAVGTPEWHRMWVERYDRAVRVIEGIAA